MGTFIASLLRKLVNFITNLIGGCSVVCLERKKVLCLIVES